MTPAKQTELLETYYTLARMYLEQGMRHQAQRVISLANQLHPAFIRQNNAVMHFGGEGHPLKKKEPYHTQAKPGTAAKVKLSQDDPTEANARQEGENPEGEKQATPKRRSKKTAQNKKTTK